MTGPYKLDNLYFDLFDDKPKEKKLKKNKNLVLIFIYNFYQFFSTKIRYMIFR